MNKSNLAKIGITGLTGLLGWHTRCLLVSRGYDVTGGGRDLFRYEDSLDRFVRECDVIVHLAGISRGSDKDLLSTNVDLTKSLLASLERTSSNVHLIFGSSQHVERETAYGESKRISTSLLSNWAEGNNKRKLTVLVLPHVFGESGKPHYNSVVSTFSYCVANHKELTVENDSMLSLLHAGGFAELVNETIVSFHSRSTEASDTDIRFVSGAPMSVATLAGLLEGFGAEYADGIIPNLSTELHIDLFNTFRSYLFPKMYPKYLFSAEDARGELVELCKSKIGGQSFVSTTVPGVVRGNHYHRRKIERFVVCQGKAMIRVRKLFDEPVFEFPVNGQEISFVDMPTLHTHSIENVGSTPLITVFWSNEIFDPDNPDTYHENVEN